MTHTQSVLLLIAATLTSACRGPVEEDAAPALTAGNAESLAAAKGAAASFAASNTGGVIKANYDGSKLPPDPRAVALCDVLHQLPATRKAACLGAQSTGITLTPLCVQTLTAALQLGHVSLDEPAIAHCREAMTAATEGCDFARAITPPIPAPCDALIAGSLPRGSACRSSLECAAGLQCFGVGPSDLGRCTPPAPVGSLCGAGVDPLANYTRQYSTEKTRPACDGYCRLNRCQAFKATGEECQSDLMCGPAGACRAGRCAAR